MARLESQLLRALEVATTRLRELNRLIGAGRPNEAHVEPIVQALRAPSAGPVELKPTAKVSITESSCTPRGETPRQLIGQPASPGAATGTVRCIRGRGDLGEFRQGEVLVCYAIDPR